MLGLEVSRLARNSIDWHRLAGARGGTLAGVVHEHDGGVELSLQVAQEAEDGGDLGDGVLVDAMQAHQGVEDEQARGEALDGVVQALAVTVMVEAQCGDVDDGDVEVMEGSGGGLGDAFETAAHEMAGILCGVHQDRAGLCGGEVTQARDARGDADGEVEGEEGFAALGFAADDADGVAAPQRVDEPLLVAGPVLELDRGSCGEGAHRRALVRFGVSPKVSKKSFSSRTSRSSSAALASRVSAMTVSVLGLPLAWAHRVSLSASVTRAICSGPRK